VANSVDREADRVEDPPAFGATSTPGGEYLAFRIRLQHPQAIVDRVHVACAIHGNPGPRVQEGRRPPPPEKPALLIESIRALSQGGDVDLSCDLGCLPKRGRFSLSICSIRRAFSSSCSSPSVRLRRSGQPPHPQTSRSKEIRGGGAPRGPRPTRHGDTISSVAITAARHGPMTLYRSIEDDSSGRSGLAPLVGGRRVRSLRSEY